MKPVIALALIIVGGLLTLATAAAGFVGGVGLMIWLKEEQQKSDLEKSRARASAKFAAVVDDAVDQPKTAVSAWPAPEVPS